MMREIMKGSKGLADKVRSGAMILTRSSLPKVTPQSKHFAVKYHWFREHVAHAGQIEVNKVHSDKQRGDIFTKPLGPGKSFPS